MKRCPKCGAEYTGDANFCSVDAERLEDVPATATSADAENANLVGNRFRLGDRIGGARTGPVFAAEDTETGEACVVKQVPTKAFASQLLLQRTERELSQLARLDVPALARIIAHGRAGDTLWVACQKVGNKSLDAVIAESGPLSPARAVAILRTVIGGLSEAAKLGVIHRDLAPKNILVGSDDSPAVINFGFAIPGDPPGVAAYASPEALAKKPLDQRSNIYSLGAILYLMLTGQAPDTQAAIEPPSKAVAGIPQALDAIVLKCLEPTAQKRFMTLRQLSGEIEKVQMEDKPSTTKPMGTAAPSAPQKAPDETPGVGGKGKARKKAAFAETLLGVPLIKEDGTIEAGKEPAAAPKPAPSSEAEAPAAAKTNEPVAKAPAPVAAKAPEPAVAKAAEPAVAKTAEPADTKAPDKAARGKVVDRPAPARVVDKPAPAKILKTPMPSATPAPAQRDEGPTDKMAIGDVPAAAAAAAPEVSAEDKTAPAPKPAPPTPAKMPALTTPASGKGKGKGKPQQAPEPQAAGTKGRFRETMWFKKGELDAAAAQAAAQKNPNDLSPDKADELPIDDRYEDDGTLTRDDQDRLSLRTGATQMMMAAIDESDLPGASSKAVSERELMSEMKGRPWLLYIALAILIAGGITAAVVI